MTWRVIGHGSAKHCQDHKIFLVTLKYFTLALFREISPTKNCSLIDSIQAEVIFEPNILAEVTFEPNILEIITIM